MKPGDVMEVDDKKTICCCRAPECFPSHIRTLIDIVKDKKYLYDPITRVPAGNETQLSEVGRGCGLKPLEGILLIFTVGWSMSLVW